MNHIFLAHPYLFFALVICVVIVLFASFIFKKRFIYTYPLTDVVVQEGYVSSTIHEQILRGLWVILLVLIALVIARPQRSDIISTERMHGVDIVLALDISDSMNMIDDPKNDPRKRIEIAKTEALNFIKSRQDDAIGLVLFAGYAISRCPLTLDKKIVNEIVSQTEIGLLDARATFLATGLITAANRLKGSPAKSKVIILLTDGSPSQGDEDPQVALEIAKQLGIKVYTIGIGIDTKVPVWNGRNVEYVSTYNQELLKEIARQTGGAFFSASNSAQMRSIYQTIDALEKTDHEVEQFCQVHDIFEPLILIAYIVLIVTIILSTFVWFGL